MGRQKAKSRSILNRPRSQSCLPGCKKSEPVWRDACSDFRERPWLFGVIRIECGEIVQVLLDDAVALARPLL